jgi:hypothetical protein
LTKWFAASAFGASPRDYAPGRTAKNMLMKSERRRSSSGVSARSADVPVTIEGVVEGIRRANE